jgi:hypothetical protein
MPSLTIQELTYILNRASIQPTVFVETGTFMGDTIFQMQPHFPELHTIELSEPHYQAAKDTAAARSYTNIQFHLGDSAEVLPTLVPTFTQPTVFWLDGHFCHCGSAQGSVDCPLHEELAAICDAHAPPAVVVIDDARLFGASEPEDWSAISATSLKAVVQDRCTDAFFVPSFLHPKDRYVLVLKAKCA